MSVTIRTNEEKKGIELIFSESSFPSKDTLSALREKGFRWHSRGKYWYAKETPERLAFAQNLASKPEAVRQDPTARDVSLSSAETPVLKRRNSFSDSYDAIGSTMILSDSNVGLLSVNEAYFKDENISYACKYGGSTITVVDLTNAGKKGKNCSAWVLTPASYGESLLCCLGNEEKLSTCKDLLVALRSGREMQSVSVRKTEFKGVDIFSPFTETKPLDKIPDKWTKRNFCAALLSGQIYQGVLVQRLTDDYRLDAAQNFGSGRRLNIPATARTFVEDWSSLAIVRTGELVKPGVCGVSFYDGYSSSKTFMFDLSCDIQEGKRREEEYSEGLAQYNKLLESSVIELSSDMIDPEKIYTVKRLEKDPNTDIYNVREEVLQGFILKDRIEMAGLDDRHVGLDEMTIDPCGFYKVSDFHNRAESRSDDDRVIDCGNFRQYVTGKALMELTAEGEYFPIVSHASGDRVNFDSLKKELEALSRGITAFEVTGLSKIGYEKSLEKLTREYSRAGGSVEGQKPKLDILISSAQNRAQGASSPAQVKELGVSR